jgi:hypothetical protein
MIFVVRSMITGSCSLIGAASRCSPAEGASPRRAKMVQLECTALQRLPAGRTTDYDEATV